MPTADDYTKTLDRLAAALRGGPLTAREIAKRFKCCRPTAYQRIEALRSRGDAIYEIGAAQSGTGPKPIAYGVR